MVSPRLFVKGIVTTLFGLFLHWNLSFALTSEKRFYSRSPLWTWDLLFVFRTLSALQFCKSWCLRKFREVKSLAWSTEALSVCHTCISCKANLRRALWVLAVGRWGMVFSPAVSHLYFLQSEFANGIVCWCCWCWGMFFSPASEVKPLASCLIAWAL